MSAQTAKPPAAIRPSRLAWAAQQRVLIALILLILFGALRYDHFLGAYNVLSVLRSKLWGLTEAEVQELVITPARRVALPTLNSMAGADSVSEAVKMIESAYHFPLQGPQSDEELIDFVEDGFAKEMRDAADLAFVWQGLSPGTILGLIKLLEFEVSNLAAIAIGVEAGMDPKKILSKLRV